MAKADRKKTVYSTSTSIRWPAGLEAHLVGFAVDSGQDKGGRDAHGGSTACCAPNIHGHPADFGLSVGTSVSRLNTTLTASGHYSS